MHNSHTSVTYFFTRCFSSNVYIYLNYPSVTVADVFLGLEGW